MLSISWDSKIQLRATEFSIEHSPVQFDREIDQTILQMAHRYCKRITSFHSKSFYIASGLLPEEKKRAARALYAFCRTTDDIVDQHGAVNKDHLHNWRQRSLHDQNRINDPVPIAWADTLDKFQIPLIYAHQLIDGVAQDLYVDRYPSFSRLSEYCYGVASTVGLMSMHIIGFSNKAAIRYAVKLGVALQLTNILRDIREDWERGRIYLPKDEMEAFNISEDHLENHLVDDSWKAFMQFQIERTRRIYEEAWPGIELLHPSGRLAIAAAASFYKDILKDIEARNYDVFNARAHITKWGKLRRLPQLWYKYGNNLSQRAAFS